SKTPAEPIQAQPKIGDNLSAGRRNEAEIRLRIYNSKCCLFVPGRGNGCADLNHSYKRSWSWRGVNEDGVVVLVSHAEAGLLQHGQIVRKVRRQIADDYAHCARLEGIVMRQQRSRLEIGFELVLALHVDEELERAGTFDVPKR